MSTSPKPSELSELLSYLDSDELDEMDNLLSSMKLPELSDVVLDGGERLPMHEGQLRAWNSTARYVAVFKGKQGGGTLIGPPWLFREMQRQGPGDYAVITPTYPLMDNKPRPALLEFFAGVVRQSGNELIVTPQGAAALWGDPGAMGRILLRHADNPEAIEAFTAAAIWIDEPGQIANEVWTAIKARAAVKRARFLMTSWPYRRNFYVKEFWEAVMEDRGGQWVRKAAADPEIECINFKSIANPRFDVAFYASERRKLPAWKFTMMYDGVPTRPAGVIFDTFTTRIHTPVDRRWARASGHDFGPLHTAGLWAYKHPTEVTEDKKPVWILYSSYCTEQAATVPEHVKEFKRRVPDKAHSWGGAGGNTQDQGWREAFSLAGYPIMDPGERSVDRGIEVLYGMFKTGELQVSSHMTRFIEELETYSWEVDDEGQPNQDKIVKKSTWHRIDSARALALGLSHGGICDMIVSKRVRKLSPEAAAQEEFDKEDGNYREPGINHRTTGGSPPLHAGSSPIAHVARQSESPKLDGRTIRAGVRRVARQSRLSSRNG